MGFLLRRLVATPLFISILCRVGRWRIILSILSSHPRVNWRAPVEPDNTHHTFVDEVDPIDCLEDIDSHGRLFMF